MAASSAQTMNRESQATEDRTDEIARLQAIHEQQQQQALIASHHANIESVGNQLREQMMAEAGARHEQMRQGYQREAVQQMHIHATEAQIIINQRTAQAEHEAQQLVGRVTGYAEEVHLHNETRNSQTRKGRERSKGGRSKSQTNRNITAQY